MLQVIVINMTQWIVRSDDDSNTDGCDDVNDTDFCCDDDNNDDDDDCYDDDNDDDNNDIVVDDIDDDDWSYLRW